ncbi:MAG: sigma-70 family RNA polymerase sigma factor [Anaerolineaceae bacterium]
MEVERFEEMLEICRRSLERYVFYRIPDREDAEELMADIQLKAFEKRDSLLDPQRFKAWILRIASNCCNDYFRERAKSLEIEWQDELDETLTMNRVGLSIQRDVRETLESVRNPEQQLLFLYYFRQMPLRDIAATLNIPVGTVKSRLYTARNEFKQHYSETTTKTNGAREMKNLPTTLPEYTITRLDSDPFEVRWEEMMGWLIVPRLGEELKWGLYDWPERRMTSWMELEVVGKAKVHGIDGVEIFTKEHDLGSEHNSSGDVTQRRFIAQLTETHCRYLAESHHDRDMHVFNTFLDGDEFLPNWGFGEDNCGKEVNLTQKGLIHREGDVFTSPSADQVMDVIGGYKVEINGKTYDTVGVMDIESYNEGVATEQFIDQNGKTVLWRRFNRNDWQIKEGCPWTERLPENTRYKINGQTYVHWYDCISDYIL